MSRRRKRKRPGLAHWLLRALVVLITITTALILPLRWLSPVTSSFMLQEQPAVRAGISYRWADRRDISRQAALAALASEDQRFFSHAGFDLRAIRDALSDGVTGGGASTISQQLAKNMWLWPARSWLRKGIEAWLTVWLELLLPKVRILELYLNVAQFGPGLYGIEAASLACFGRPASRLSAAQAALLVANLPRPSALSVQNPAPHIRARQRWIEAQLPVLARTVPLAGWAGT